MYTAVVDSESLRTFLSVYREGGFSAAAEVLHVTQPAVTHRVQMLEREIGEALFERMSRGVVLTQAGRALLPFAERVFAAMNDVQSALDSFRAGERGPIAIAVVGTLADRRLTRVLRSFARTHAGVDVALETATSASVSELVRRGRADVGLRYHFDQSADLTCEELAQEPLFVVCSPQHPLAGQSIASLRKLRDERWLAFPEIPGQREISTAHVFGLFLTAGAGEVRWTPVDSLTAQKRLVESGYGLALMARSHADEELADGSLATIHVRNLRAALPVVVVTRANGFLSVATADMLKSLREAYVRR